MDENKLFENGCFLPSWTEDIDTNSMPISRVHTERNKDLKTLYAELEEIKQHIQDVQERQWNLAKLLHYHENDFARE